jgi:hypothetical protein
MGLNTYCYPYTSATFTENYSLTGLKRPSSWPIATSTHGLPTSDTTSGSKSSTTRLQKDCNYIFEHHISLTYECVPPYNKRSNKAERAIQTFKRHFITILAGTHPSFPINFWHELISQAELTLNMMRSYADQPTISAYHGIRRRPFDFASHPRLWHHAAPSS